MPREPSSPSTHIAASQEEGELLQDQASWRESMQLQERGNSLRMLL